MTFIQHTTSYKPTRHLFRMTFIIMLAAIFVGVVTLVVLYNQTVAAQHAARDLNNHTVALQSENADRDTQLMTTLDSQNLATFAASRGLVEDRTPEYVQAAPEHTWAFAGRF